MLVSGLTVWAISEEIDKADKLWESHQIQGITEKAIAVLEALAAKEPNNYEALWRLGRYYQFLGEVSFNNERTVALEKGLGYAEKAIKANEQGVNGYLWHAILIGCILWEKHDISSLNLVKQMADELQTVIKLDSNNGTAYILWRNSIIARPENR